MKWGVLKETVFSQLLKDVSGETDKVMCPGLTKYYPEIHENLSTGPKGARAWSFPFSRVDSERCLLFHQNRHQNLNSPLFKVCDNCKCKVLKHRMEITVRKQINKCKDKGQEVKLKTNWRFLSLKSRLSLLHLYKAKNQRMLFEWLFERLKNGDNSGVFLTIFFHRPGI